MQFRATHKKGFYKNEDAWIRAVYRKNKAVLSEVIDNPTLGKFKNLIKMYQQDPYVKQKTGKKVPTKKEALEALGRSTVFKTEAERLSENALSGIRRDKEMFNEIRKHLGWKQKITMEDLKWDSKEKAYIIRKGDNVVRIKFNNSPKNGKGSLYNIYW